MQTKLPLEKGLESLELGKTIFKNKYVFLQVTLSEAQLSNKARCVTLLKIIELIAFSAYLRLLFTPYQKAPHQKQLQR